MTNILVYLYLYSYTARNYGKVKGKPVIYPWAQIFSGRIFSILIEYQNHITFDKKKKSH